MKRLSSLLVAGMTLLSSSAAFAAEEAQGKWTFAVEGFYIIDFLIYAALLVWLVRGPARKFIRARYERMTSEIQAASRLKAEADQKLAEIEALFASLERDVAGIRDQFRADGERERERIAAETNAATEKLRTSVEKQLAQDTAALKEKLQLELVDAVLTATEAKIRAKVDGATHRALNGAYIDNLEKLDSLAGLEKAA